MKVNEFRKAILSHSGVIEGEHMGHADFRYGGKIFASLGAPNDDWAMVKLTPEQQTAFVSSLPHVFVPPKGAWGRSGSTLVHLAVIKDRATADIVKAAIEIAVENFAARGRDQPAKQPTRKKSAPSRKTAASKPSTRKSKNR